VEYATVDKGGKSLPALLSLCNSSRVCLLWIDKLSDKGFKFDSLPPSLADLLQDQSIMKVGSGIVHDARSLMDTWRSAKLTDSLPPQSFNIQGLVEISEIDQLEFQDELRRLRALDIMGIQAMTIASLGRRLKKQKVSRKDDEKRSHWRAKSMTETMTLYAAEDVYAGLKIYQSLTSKLTVEEMNRIPRATVAFRD
jgi:ribonuclease D